MAGVVWAVVVAAGAGARFGTPKQFADLAGHRVIDHAIAAARAVCDGVVVVLPPWSPEEVSGVDSIVAGGETRSESVRRGLAAVPAEAEVVLVHDGARPLAPPSLFRAVLDAVRAGADAVVPVVPIPDTVRWRDGGTADRDALVAVQTPQGFRADRLRAAHAGGAEATDDVTLVEAAGGKVVTVPGVRANMKITDPLDLEIARALMGIAAKPGSTS